MARELAKASLHSFGWCKQLLIDSFHNPIRVSHRARASGTILLCSSSRWPGRIKGIFGETKTKIQPQMNLIEGLGRRRFPNREEGKSMGEKRRL